MASVQDDQEHNDRESSSEAGVSEAEKTEEGRREGSEGDLGSSSRLDSKKERPATVRESDVLRALKNRPQGLSLKDIKNIILQDNAALEKLPATSVKSKIMSALDKVIQKGQAVKQRRGMTFVLLQPEGPEQTNLGSRRERKKRSLSRSSKPGKRAKRKSSSHSRLRKTAQKRASGRNRGNRRKKSQTGLENHGTDTLRRQLNRPPALWQLSESQTGLENHGTDTLRRQLNRPTAL
ncbi:hypothetical protein RRG08_040046 [Elysia crispata]|uniref:Uncharacterized protein n=1 Tax=Elysia crispata TaxID=231223 RepID=A0AAE1CMW4_9GAST|nr:hypothetical protein RRG08_040046 [Elysia crispata]